MTASRRLPRQAMLVIWSSDTPKFRAWLAQPCLIWVVLNSMAAHACFLLYGHHRTTAITVVMVISILPLDNLGDAASC